MITEEFENRKAPSKKLRSVEPYNFQEENEKLIREKKELEKTIEKLEFFNGLLEKEINELKEGGNEQEQSDASPTPLPFYYRPKKRVSRQAFNLVLCLALILGAFALYSIFIVKADYPFFRRLQGKPPVQLSSPAENRNNTPDPSAPAGSSINQQSSSNALPPTAKAGLAASPGPIGPMATTANETVIKENKQSAASLNPLQNETLNRPVPGQDAGGGSGDRGQQKNAPAAVPENNPSLAAPANNIKENAAAAGAQPIASGGVSLPNSSSSSKNESAFAITTVNATNAPTRSAPNINSPSSNNPSTPNTSANPSTSNASSAAGGDSKKSLGVYKVASKANFYDKPDPTALNGTFIYQFSTVELHALDETKDFIYVATVNNLGNTIKGWLSKKDLRRIDQ